MRAPVGAGRTGAGTITKERELRTRGSEAPDRLAVGPIARFQGTLSLPGSKSLSNRIVLLSALAEGETEVWGVLESEDTEVMLTALRALRVDVRGQPGGRGAMWVTGQAGPLNAPLATTDVRATVGHPEPLALFLGNAGTAMRPLTAVLAAGVGTFVLEGVPRMHERPIGDLVTGQRQLGAHVTYLARGRAILRCGSRRWAWPAVPRGSAAPPAASSSPACS